MLPKEVLHIGDGILQAKPEFLKKILVDAEIEQHYVVEEKPFARWVASAGKMFNSSCKIALRTQLHCKACTNALDSNNNNPAQWSWREFSFHFLLLLT